MHRPVLVTPAARLPITLDEAKADLRVDYADEDALITGLIGAATKHLDGWTGVLGQCLVDQAWRQDFDCFSRCLPIPLGPVIEIGSVTWRNSAGNLSTVSASSYSLSTDVGGRSSVRFKSAFSFPADLSETAAVSVTFRAGYETTPASDGPPATPEICTVPDDLKLAIMLLVAHWFNNREAAASETFAELPLGVATIVAPYRRVGV